MKPSEMSLTDRSMQTPAAHRLSVPGITLRGVLSVLGGLFLLAMMALTVLDVLGRYLLNAPVAGAGELTEVLLCGTIFLGLCAVALRDEHVTVDLITDLLPDWVQPWRRVACGVFGSVILGLVTWRLAVYAGQIGSYGGQTSTLKLPIAPLGYFCALCTGVGAVLSTVVPVHRLIRYLKG